MGDKANLKKSNDSKAQGKRRETIKEFKQRMAREGRSRTQSDSNSDVHDFYEKISSSIKNTRKSTGLVYDDSMKDHYNKYDQDHPENPERYQAIMTRLQQLSLIDRCKRIKICKATKEDICKLHTSRLFENLQDVSSKNDVQDFENEASKFDSVYFNKETFEASCTSAGGVITLIKAICKGDVQNGMAVVRPPGHHAMENEYNGYCFFNNVALAAKIMIEEDLARKILIIDHDVHHGQGTQRFFYNSNSVLYFSIHRYEHGLFWPNLKESNFHYIGADSGEGYNINVPLNETGAGDSEYLAIILHILLPIAYEGEMMVTPGFYGHLIKLISGLAGGKIAVCLEGGYFLPSLAEGAAMSLKALLDDPPCNMGFLSAPTRSVADVINSLKLILRPFWKCFQSIETYPVTEDNAKELHEVSLRYLGEPSLAPYPTRDCYPLRSEAERIFYSALVDKFQNEYQLLTKHPVAYTYDEELLQHIPKKNHYECPKRLQILMEKFKEFELDQRCQYVPAGYADMTLLKAIHGHEYLESIIKDLPGLVTGKKDLYCSEESVNCILKSAGCLLSLVDHIMTKQASCGAALIRPPGHHAGHEEAAGFCFINNVAIAAYHLRQKYDVQRILIIDFDVHHGNGTQNIFYDNDNVFYMSIHRYDEAKFYPHSTEGNYDRIGTNKGKGYNMNIPFNKDLMTDSEYVHVFHRIILPVAYQYNPEIILVSAGFDAGINDPLGHYKLTPEVYGHFVQLLKAFAKGKIILALEGGYNFNTVAYSMISCIKTLLGDPLPQLDEFRSPKASACKTIANVIGTHKSKWNILGIDKKLPNEIGDVIIKGAIRGDQGDVAQEK